MRAKDVVADSNILSGLGAGAVLSNQDLATFMVVVSDNGATNVLIDRLHMESVNSLLGRLALPHTRLRRKMVDSQAVRRGLEALPGAIVVSIVLPTVLKEGVPAVLAIALGTDRPTEAKKRVPELAHLFDRLPASGPQGVAR